MRAAAGQFTASACHFVHWDNHSKGAPAIQLDAGRAIVQGCTFASGGTHVAAAREVRSAIVTANQASGGMHVENLAGPRVQLLANEADPMDITPGARLHYRFDVGGDNDDAFLKLWHGRERMGPRTMRWSQPGSTFSLPVVPGKAYRLSIELGVSPAAVSPEAGLYLDGKRLAPLAAGDKTIAVDLPPATTERVAVELRVRGWVPKATNPASNDDRTLGASAFSVTMKAPGAEDRIFDASRGDWLPPAKKPVPEGK
jgi:hypothetical protein